MALPHRPRTALIALLVAVLTLAGCTSRVVEGSGSPAGAPVAAQAELPVVGDSGSQLDNLIKNAISDVELFWKQSYPTVSGGKAFAPLQGKLYSVDGENVTSADRANGCLRQDDTAALDNAFYCRVDDSVVWDRNTQHLIGVLGAKYGSFLDVMVFAHEFGHAIQNRLGVFDDPPPTIVTESQADCAAGAFAGWAEAGKAPHFRVTSGVIDEALFGYLQVRDRTPVSTSDISHGNGFDRLGAVSDGIEHGVAYCYSADWANRTFTERPFTQDSDYASGGNECLEQVVNPATPDPSATGCSGGGGLQPNLNTYWSAAAKTVGKSWTAVQVAEAGSPPCAASSVRFGYCADTGTVYYENDYASRAYNSLPTIQVSKSTGDVQVVDNTPADYALGELFVIGWGLAVRHELFGTELASGQALLAAVCYSGAYSKSINVAQTANTTFVLSPPDMDEATSAVLNLVPEADSFGARGTTGLQRIQAFRLGYGGGLASCNTFG